MIPSIGVMIGFYIIARYCEMSVKSNLAGRIGLLLLTLATMSILWSGFLHPAMVVTP